MYYVYFARGYSNEEMIAECRTLEAAQLRADEEYANGARDIALYDTQGRMIYEPEEESLYDEF
jgi:uncharacterized membrane protein YkoI